MISISYAFRVAPSTVSQIVMETCSILWDCLHEQVLLNPSEAAWMNVAEEFEHRWHLPHCVGAMDGKHVLIQVSIALEFHRDYCTKYK